MYWTMPRVMKMMVFGAFLFIVASQINLHMTSNYVESKTKAAISKIDDARVQATIESLERINKMLQAQSK